MLSEAGAHITHDAHWRQLIRLHSFSVVTKGFILPFFTHTVGLPKTRYLKCGKCVELPFNCLACWVKGMELAKITK